MLLNSLFYLLNKFIKNNIFETIDLLIKKVKIEFKK